MIKIIEELERVQKPPYDEPKHIRVMVQMSKDEEPEEAIMHEDQVKLLRTLERLQTTANIYPDSMNEIWKQIRAYARSEYSVGFEAGLEIDNEEEKS